MEGYFIYFGVLCVCTFIVICVRIYQLETRSKDIEMEDKYDD